MRNIVKSKLNSKIQILGWIRIKRGRNDIRKVRRKRERRDERLDVWLAG